MITDREIDDIIEKLEYLSLTPFDELSLRVFQSDFEETLSKAVKMLSNQARWLPISEAKTDGTRYLVSADGQQYVASWYDGYPYTKGVWKVAEAEESLYIAEVIIVYPTHFQPLPTPPEE